MGGWMGECGWVSWRKGGCVDGWMWVGKLEKRWVRGWVDVGG